MFSLFLSASCAHAALYDLILDNGHLIDAAKGINAVMDIAIKGGKIARVAPGIDSSLAERSIGMEGNYVSPGFIDLHTHVYQGFKGDVRPVIADHVSFPGGVTTCVDAGTSGADNFEDFSKVIEGSRLRILAFLNISRTGMNRGENAPKNFDVDLAVRTAKKYHDTIIGFKSAHYWRRWKGDHPEPRPYDDIHTPWASVDSVVQAGRLAGKPVMIDFDPFPAQGRWPARSYSELLLKRLRPGDIHTHCYARRFKVIGEDGKVAPQILTARGRGILFDVGHGGGSMAFSNAIPAIRQGYLPDTISTDIHAGNVNGPVVNMGFVLSKFLNMGMTLEEIMPRVTVNPARIIGRQDLGTLTPGSPADITVFKVIKEDVTFVDCKKNRIRGDRFMRIVMTVSGGKVVFNPYGLGLPSWNGFPKPDRRTALPGKSDPLS